ncbi:stress response translation initiation inhibitor YciH [Candidatus Woesearchaeota archaeon]|nr:stress response translation initiation inhibitor YciH [Candidatus Woesearchaeota archaeon]
MPEIDPITGLPKELGAWDNITKESQKITIKIIKKKFGKKYTVVEGINKHEVNIKEITKKLKNKFACGGTAKEGHIELQGDHMKDIRKELVTLGFAPDQIEK